MLPEEEFSPPGNLLVLPLSMDWKLNGQRGVLRASRNESGTAKNECREGT